MLAETKARVDCRVDGSELDPQGLVGPLETEVRPLDLALGFAVLPEDQPLDVVRPQILAQALERPRRVLDDALAVLFEAVVGERVGVALEVRSDGLVCAVAKASAACVVVGGDGRVRDPRGPERRDELRASPRTRPRVLPFAAADVPLDGRGQRTKRLSLTRQAKNPMGSRRKARTHHCQVVIKALNFEAHGLCESKSALSVSSNKLF